MSQYLRLPREKFREIPLTVEPDHSVQTVPSGDKVCVGYFARICPEKGIQNFLRAASKVSLHFPDVEFHVGGYLSGQHRRWFEKLLKTAQLSARDRIHWLGSPQDRTQKLNIIGQFDVLCVPADYHEPKGLYVLEAAMMGVPPLLPHHGAFPELIERLGSGRLYDPSQPDALENALTEVLTAGVGRSMDLSETTAQLHSMEATSQTISEVILEFTDR